MGFRVPQSWGALHEKDFAGTLDFSCANLSVDIGVGIITTFRTELVTLTYICNNARGTERNAVIMVTLTD
jgi:hypothetical protein